MSSIATHDGKVVAVQPKLVKVEMHVVSACSSCEAHEKCAFVDKADKIVEIPTDQWQQYRVGDSVVVSVNERLGLLAVLLAYCLPALLLIASILVFSYTLHSEGIAALAAILVTAAYFLLLYRFRNSLSKKFSFGIRPKTKSPEKTHI